MTHTDEEQVVRTVTTYREVLQELCSRLEPEYMAVPNNQGLTLYSQCKTLPGLKTPNKWYYYKPVSGIAMTVAYSHLRSVLDEWLQECEKHELNTVKRVLLDLIDRSKDPRSNTAIAASGIEEEGVTLSLFGNSGYRKVLPCVSWFPENVQALDPRSLLTLFPDAEKEQLMMILGRVVIGSNGSNTAEGTILHTFRSYGIIIGRDPGMGKSTLLGYIAQALTTLGYSTNTVNLDLNRFGWGRIASADLALIDDLTDDSQHKLIRDPRVKSLVSGGTLTVEEKGEHSHAVNPKCVILGCSNHTDYTHFLGVDSGSLDRLNQLDTYSREELAEHLGDDQDYRIRQYWEHLATQLGTDTNVLAMWLLRCCGDMFLDLTGHIYNEQVGMLSKDPNADKLEQVSKANRDQFRIDVSLRHLEELVKASTLLVAFTAVNQKRPLSLLEDVAQMDYSPHLLLYTVAVFCQCEDLPDPWDRLYLKELSREVVRYLAPKLREYTQINYALSMDKAFERISKELKSRKGFGYPTKMTHYQNIWNQERRRIPYLIEQFLDLPDPPKDLERMYPNVLQLIKGLPIT